MWSALHIPQHKNKCKYNALHCVLLMTQHKKKSYFSSPTLGSSEVGPFETEGCSCTVPCVHQSATGWKMLFLQTQTRERGLLIRVLYPIYVPISLPQAHAANQKRFFKWKQELQCRDVQILGGRVCRFFCLGLILQLGTSLTDSKLKSILMVLTGQSHSTLV